MYVSDQFVDGKLPQTALGELTVLPKTPSWIWVEGNGKGGTERARDRKGTEGVEGK